MRACHRVTATDGALAATPARMNVTQPSVPSSPFRTPTELARSAFLPPEAYGLGETYRGGRPRPIASHALVYHRLPTPPTSAPGSTRRPDSRRSNGTPQWVKPTPLTERKTAGRTMQSSPIDWRLSSAEIEWLSRPSIFRLSGGAGLHIGRKLERRPKTLPGFGWPSLITSR